MVFSSSVFLVLFLPIVLFFYFFPVPKKINRKYKNIILLLSSLGFYAYGEPVFVFIMIFSICVNYYIANAMNSEKNSGGYRKTLLIISLIFNVGLLFVFKYLSFVIKNLNYLSFIKLPSIQVALPIGISFFTFQIMSYIFDVYYKKVPSQKSWINLALYISLFPQLVAGPIVRYQTIQDEIMNRKENFDDISKGIKRFIFGLAKKCLLANYMAILADEVFASNILDLTTANAWLGAIAYTLQIYFDFSGYSDMAIGLGLIFGFHFDENFNYPYFACSVTDFWRRWHISLSSWFRDYVYIPLGGNRCSKIRWIFNLACVWALTGLWHGANWTFIFWGIYYFVLLLIEKLILFKKKNDYSKNIFMHIYALCAVIVGWVFFRAENLSFAFSYLKRMFCPFLRSVEFGSLFNNYLVNQTFVLTIIAIIFCFPIFKFLENKLENFYNKNNSTTSLEIKSSKIKFSRIIFFASKIFKNVFTILLFILAFFSIVKSTYNPFIYFNF